MSLERTERITPGSREFTANAAAYARGVIMDPTQTTRFRMQAAKLILPFLAPMPKAAKAGLKESLAWLDGLMRKAGS